MLVYMASPEFTKEISKNIQQYDFGICIHLGRDKGSAAVMFGNDDD